MTIAVDVLAALNTTPQTRCCQQMSSRCRSEIPARLLVTVPELAQKATAAAQRSSRSGFRHAPNKLGDSSRHEFRVVGHRDMAEPWQLDPVGVRKQGSQALGVAR